MTITELRSTLGSWVAAGVLMSGVAPASPLYAQSIPTASGGPALFRQLPCATCHGTSGQGDGPMATLLKIRPADLTRIAARNRGTFPAEQVFRAIDGRKPVASHGGGEMPVWGDAFGKSRDETSVDQRIQGLVTYLESIQAKS